MINLKTTLKFLAIPALLAFGGQAQAGLCWQGYVDGVAEGSFNQDNMFMLMSDANGNRIAGGFQGGEMMRISPTLSDERKRSLRALAYLAVTNGLFVEVRAAGACNTSVDEIKVFRAPLTS